MFDFLIKYIFFLLPKFENLETFNYNSNKNLCILKVDGYMNYFESIGIFNFLGDSEIYLMNYLKFELIFKTSSNNCQHNLTLLRSFQLPATKK